MREVSPAHFHAVLYRVEVPVHGRDHHILWLLGLAYTHPTTKEVIGPKYMYVSTYPPTTNFTIVVKPKQIKSPIHYLHTLGSTFSKHSLTLSADVHAICRTYIFFAWIHTISSKQTYTTLEKQFEEQIILLPLTSTTEFIQSAASLLQVFRWS